MDWIIGNKEWLFSGLLVAAPIALLGGSSRSGKCSVGWGLATFSRYDYKIKLGHAENPVRLPIGPANEWKASLSPVEHPPGRLAYRKGPNYRAETDSAGSIEASLKGAV
jgi:hypothetical protein